MTIKSILSAYGFRATEDGAMTEGRGSLVWGHWCEVRDLGGDRYAYRVHAWAYAPDGECLADEETQGVAYGARLLEAVLPVACRER